MCRGILGRSSCGWVGEDVGVVGLERVVGEEGEVVGLSCCFESSVWFGVSVGLREEGCVIIEVME